MTKEIEDKKREIEALERQIAQAQVDTQHLNDKYAGKCFSHLTRRSKTDIIEMTRFQRFELLKDLKTIVCFKDSVSVCTGDRLYPATFSHTSNLQSNWSDSRYSTLYDSVEVDPAVFDSFTKSVKVYLGVLMAKTTDIHKLRHQVDDTIVEEAVSEICIDAPHLVLDSRECRILRDSPFLCKTVFFVTPNSVEAAKKHIHYELSQTRLGGSFYAEGDWRYVERVENELNVLLQRLSSAAL